VSNQVNDTIATLTPAALELRVTPQAWRVVGAVVLVTVAGALALVASLSHAADAQIYDDVFHLAVVGALGVMGHVVLANGRPKQ